MRHSFPLLAALCVAALGCSDIAPVNQSIAGPSGSKFEISDAVHSGGTAGFYFLPPLVAQPNDTGAFDATRSVSIQVCPLGNPAASSCTDAGVLISPVEVDVNGNHYQVNWNTDAAAFPAGSYYRIIVTDNSTGGEWGHADVYLANTGKEFRGINQTEFVPLLDGRTVPIKFRIDQGAQAPGGGSPS